MRTSVFSFAALSLAVASLGLLGLKPAPPLSSPAAVVPSSPSASAQPALHCQVPCGIYTDQMRIAMLMEDCATIEKAMGQIAIEPDSAQARQQMVRWVQTKEDHAQKIQDTVAQYWLAQRVKPLAADFDEAARIQYLGQLTHLHHITVHAMRCKQTLDTANVEALREAARAFSSTYFSAEDLEHLKGHHWK